MATFSERVGARPVREVLQVDSIDDALRNKLWNAFDVAVLQKRPDPNFYGNNMHQYERQLLSLLNLVWHELLKQPVDTIPDVDRWNGEFRPVLRQMFYSWDWHDVYSFIEFVAQNAPKEWSENLRAVAEVAMETEKAGYRFVDKAIVPITNSTEIESLKGAATSPLDSVRQHIGRAIELYSDRIAPDYRNSVKESISAIEAVCKVVAESNSASLGDALKKLKMKKAIHPALEQGLLKLYGYTSDEGGIRHALIEGSNVPTAAEAKLMLILSSAFTNYVVELSAVKASPPSRN